MIVNKHGGRGCKSDKRRWLDTNEACRGKVGQIRMITTRKKKTFNSNDGYGGAVSDNDYNNKSSGWLWINRLNRF